MGVNRRSKTVEEIEVKVMGNPGVFDGFYDHPC
jgi:hypothetical protein